MKQNNLIVTLHPGKLQDAILHCFEYKYLLSCHAEMVSLLENGVFPFIIQECVPVTLHCCRYEGRDCTRSWRHSFRLCNIRFTLWSPRVFIVFRKGFVNIRAVPEEVKKKVRKYGVVMQQILEDITVNVQALSLNH